MEKEEIIKNLIEKKEKLVKEYVGKAYSSVTMFRKNTGIDILGFCISTSLKIFKIVDFHYYYTIDVGGYSNSYWCSESDLYSLGSAELDKTCFIPVIDNVEFQNCGENETRFEYIKNKMVFEGLSSIHKYKEIPPETFDHMVEATHKNVNKIINLDIKDSIPEDSPTYPSQDILNLIRSKYELLELTKDQYFALIWHPFVYGNNIIVCEGSLEFIEDRLNRVSNIAGENELIEVYNKMKSILDARVQKV